LSAEVVLLNQTVYDGGHASVVRGEGEARVALLADVVVEGGAVGGAENAGESIGTDPVAADAGGAEVVDDSQTIEDTVASVVDGVEGEASVTEEASTVVLDLAVGDQGEGDVSRGADNETVSGFDAVVVAVGDAISDGGDASVAGNGQREASLTAKTGLVLVGDAEGNCSDAEVGSEVDPIAVRAGCTGGSAVDSAVPNLKNAARIVGTRGVASVTLTAALVEVSQAVGNVLEASSAVAGEVEPFLALLAETTDRRLYDAA